MTSAAAEFALVAATYGRSPQGRLSNSHLLVLKAQVGTKVCLTLTLPAS